MQVHTPPQGKCPIDDYTQRSLVLLIPGSRLITRNSPGAHPYCNCQLLGISQIKQNRKNSCIMWNILIYGNSFYRVGLWFRNGVCLEWVSVGGVEQLVGSGLCHSLELYTVRYWLYLRFGIPHPMNIPLTIWIQDIAVLNRNFDLLWIVLSLSCK